MPKHFSSVGIVGLGLMGGSLARALKALPEAPHVSGITLLEEDLAAALEAGAIDRGFSDAEDFLRGLDLVVLCTPLGATLEFLREVRERVEAQTLLTDVVSLKEPVLREARKLGLEEAFVGSHPMAGGEAAGFRASRPDLFKGARIWVCRGEAKPEGVSGVSEFWEGLGGEPTPIDAKEHDELMTWVSHLPQLVSSTRGSVFQRHAIGREDLGPGGRDMTRLAGSSPEMWIDLLEEAPESLQTGLGAVEELIAELRKAFRAGETGEARRLMENSRTWFQGRS